MDTMDTMESVKQKPSLKLILCICMVASMGIMDMPDILTPMDTMDTMESVKQKPSLKLILCICMVASMDITDMLDTHTPMDTMDIMESVKQKLSLKLMLIPFTCTVASMDIMDMLDILTPMDIMDTLDRYEHHQMNLTQKLDTNAFFFSNIHISVLDFNTRIKSREYGEFVLL